MTTPLTAQEVEDLRARWTARYGEDFVQRLSEMAEAGPDEVTRVLIALEQSGLDLWQPAQKWRMRFADLVRTRSIQVLYHACRTFPTPSLDLRFECRSIEFHIVTRFTEAGYQAACAYIEIHDA